MVRELNIIEYDINPTSRLEVFLGLRRSSSNHHQISPVRQPTWRRPIQMPRKIPIRPPRPSRRPSHPLLPPGLQVKRSLVRRPRYNLELSAQQKLPPKIVALDVAPRIPLSTNLTDQARRLARIEQIKQLYTPREFKRLRDQQLQLVLPESPLKTTQGRIRLGLLFWVYFSIMVSCLQFQEYLYTKKQPEGIQWDFWKRWREWLPHGLLYDPEDDDIDPVAFAKSLDEN